MAMNEFEQVLLTLFQAGLDYKQIAHVHKVYTGEKLSKETFEWVLRKQLKNRRQGMSEIQTWHECTYDLNGEYGRDDLGFWLTCTECGKTRLFDVYSKEELLELFGIYDD